MIVPGPDSAVRLRALAHPLRWRLLGVIDHDGTATATRCAEVVGESVASCSYHLKILAKYGYIEPAERRGRDKPWRLTSRRQDLSPHGRGPQAELVAQQAVAAFLTHELERLVAHHRGRGKLPRRWQEAVGLGGATVWVTAAELRTVRDELLAILHRYADRDSSARPKGGRQARIFVSASVDPGPELGQRS